MLMPALKGTVVDVIICSFHDSILPRIEIRSSKHSISYNILRDRLIFKTIYAVLAYSPYEQRALSFLKVDKK